MSDAEIREGRAALAGKPKGGIAVYLYGEFDRWWESQKDFFQEVRYTRKKRVAEMGWEAAIDRLELLTCTWTQEDDVYGGHWETQCGQAFVFEEGSTPNQDGINYCCFCGNRITGGRPGDEEGDE